MVLLEVLTDPRTLGPLLLTLRVLALAGCILLPGGVLLAYFLSGKPSALRVVVDFIVSIPLVFPPIATGFILLMLFGRSGFMGRVLPEVVFAFPGLVLASAISGLPLLVKPVEAALRNQGTRLSEVAAVLGKTPWQTFVLVLLPAIRRPVLAGWLLALSRSMGEVGITLMLGGNILGKTNTLSLEIYNCVFTGEIDRAIVLCGIIGTLSCGMLFTLKRMSAI